MDSNAYQGAEFNNSRPAARPHLRLVTDKDERPVKSADYDRRASLTIAVGLLRLEAENGLAETERHAYLDEICELASALRKGESC